MPPLLGYLPQLPLPLLLLYNIPGELMITQMLQLTDLSMTLKILPIDLN